MLGMAKLSFLLSCSLLLQVVIAVPNIEDCFSVDFSTDDQAGSRSYETVLRNLWTDTQALAAAGAQLADDYGNDAVATRLINGYFRQPTPANTGEINQIKKYLKDVNTFVSNPFTGNNKPYLFTGDGWLQAVSPTDQLKDTNGNGVSNAQGPVQAQSDADLVFTGSQRTWFSVKHNRYLIDRSWGTRGGQPIRYCDVSTHQAVTQDKLIPASITFCPRSYTLYGGQRLDASIVNTQNLPIILNRTPRGLSLQLLPTILPTALTMYHELFHLVEGATNTPPNGLTELYPLNQILGLENRALIVSNPETYALAALAYYYSLHTTPRVDFSAGGKGMQAS